MKEKEIIKREKILLQNSKLWKSAFLQLFLIHKLKTGKLNWEEAFSELNIPKPDDFQQLYKCLDDRDIKGSQTKAFLALLMTLGLKKEFLAMYFDVSTRLLRKIMLLRKRGNLNEITKNNIRERIPRHLRTDVQSVVTETLHEPPSLYGINRTTWTINLLTSTINQSQPKLEFNLTRSNISHTIKAMGYRFKKTKEVLTSNDPDYKIKLRKITTTLQRLGPADRFFSIDEYGPISVKHRGGKLLVPDGARPVVEQYQYPKGKVIMTAALELVNNQVSYFYSEKKDSEEMVKLAKFLQQKYHYCRYLYFSWDAASWHSSKYFLSQLKQINDPTYRNNNQLPKIILRPLPARAQFLNVIEPVFSGMSRSIIQNSNYSTVEEMRNAIDLYFKERNDFFRKNPHRAGNKIWGNERTKSSFSVSNNCKDVFIRHRH
ncbi:transposase [Rhodobacteraceae bacterium]|nr:transposase [Paracoccaceae bacterium]